MLKLKVVDLATDPQLMGALGAAEYARQKGWTNEREVRMKERDLEDRKDVNHRFGCTVRT